MISIVPSRSSAKHNAATETVEAHSVPRDLLQGIEAQTEEVQRALMIAAIRDLSAQLVAIKAGLWAIAVPIIVGVLLYVFQQVTG